MIRTRSGTAVVGLFLMSSLISTALPARTAGGDPNQKLTDAQRLFDKDDKPVPAEVLIRDAIDAFTAAKDHAGLADAYRTYGLFFRCASVEKWRAHYEKKKFLEPNTAFWDRYDRSIDYLNKAEIEFSDLNRNDELANLEKEKARTYYFAGDIPNACAAYDESVAFYAKHRLAHPKDEKVLPPGYGSYEAYIRSLKKAAKCPQ